MAKKFKVNDRVRVIATGEVGTVKGREVTPVEGTKQVNVEYVVKVGDGFANWKTFSKKEIEAIRTDNEELRVYTKVYDVVDGFKITMYAKVNNYRTLYNTKERSMTMGYAIYSPEDDYNPTKGMKIARRRSRTSPFCYLVSEFNGEFNAATVEALMDVKADYIKNNFDKFIKHGSKK